VIIKHLSCVEKIKILSGKVVTSGRLIDNQKDADRLKCVDKNLKDFAKNVDKVNLRSSKIS
jgi:carbonic anhydrase/acetyltransferase-like protein (isoleucine patch superfamily)